MSEVDNVGVANDTPQYTLSMFKVDGRVTLVRLIKRVPL